jgi:hypothetical protein
MWSNWWNENWQGKTVPVPFCPLKIPHDLTWSQTQAAEVVSRWLTTACQCHGPRVYVKENTVHTCVLVWIGWICGMDYTGTKYGSQAGSFEYGNEVSESITAPYRVSAYHLLLYLTGLTNITKDTRILFKISARNPLGMRWFWRQRREWEDKTVLGETVSEFRKWKEPARRCVQKRVLLLAMVNTWAL